ncbi:MAG: extracellular solute-binding protein [Devosia sp.]|nr:extracellular solute-binding protein [Devosia sp.]
MTTPARPSGFTLNRRDLMRYTASAALLAGLSKYAMAAAAIDLSAVTQDQWTPDFISSIAGTEEVDTAAECAKIVPLDYTGHLTYWYVGPDQSYTPLQTKYENEFWEAFHKTYPNITVDKTNIDYNSIADKLRTAALGNAAPMCVKLMLLWGAEFASKGQLAEFKPEDVGFKTSDFWPKAIASTMWKGKQYGVPTNNETMAFIWNSAIFKAAGLEPEKAPETWDDVVAYSKQIKEKTGKNGYGLVARSNAGNTPYRFMPEVWAEGGGAYDEADPNPTYQKIDITNDGTKKALRQIYQMYVVDKSVPTSALTNTQTQNEDPFLAGDLAMMISHPTEYAYMLAHAAKVTGPDKAAADAVVVNMRYGLVPKGDVRRAIVFGGWNLHVFADQYVDGGKVDKQAVKAFIAFQSGPEWSVKLNWVQSNPGNLRGFKTKWMRERLDTIKFLNVTTSMLPSGIAFPVIPESTEVMNIIVPDMMQNVLTGKMSIDDATADATNKIQNLGSGF